MADECTDGESKEDFLKQSKSEVNRKKDGKDLEGVWEVILRRQRSKVCT